MNSLINCATCQREIIKKTASHRYCPECSQIQDLKRKRLWAKENYGDKERQRSLIYSRKEKESAELVRRDISKNNDSGIGYMSKEVTPVKSFRFSMPFTTALLKNHSWSLARKGHVFLKKETRVAQEQIHWSIKASGTQWVHNKIWIDLLIQKPDHKSGDAINMLDRIADAIKGAIGIDDRWFCVRRIDWEIIKENPKIFIGISQEDCVGSQVCSICGRILPFDNFPKHKHTLHGYGRWCKECQSAVRKKVHKSENPRTEFVLKEF